MESRVLGMTREERAIRRGELELAISRNREYEGTADRRATEILYIELFNRRETEEEVEENDESSEDLRDIISESEDKDIQILGKFVDAEDLKGTLDNLPKKEEIVEEMEFQDTMEEFGERVTRINNIQMRRERNILEIVEEEHNRRVMNYYTTLKETPWEIIEREEINWINGGESSLARLGGEEERENIRIAMHDAEQYAPLGSALLKIILETTEEIDSLIRNHEYTFRRNWNMNGSNSDLLISEIEALRIRIEKGQKKRSYFERMKQKIILFWEERTGLDFHDH